MHDIFFQIFNKYSDRFLTGTDFVATFGSKEEYPGLKKPPTGCMKDKVRFPLLHRTIVI